MHAPDTNHWLGYAQSQYKNQRTRKLARQMMRTIRAYDLIREGDHILLAISGGKDSYTLLDLLERARHRAPFPFEITAVHLDQGQPGYDGTGLKAWLKDARIPHQILSEDTYAIVKETTDEGATYCTLCSRLRRGILYTAAASLGCNKIALGHHREDALETFLLNLFYAGKTQAMPASYTTNDGRFEVIRPLIECSEKEIAAHARRRAFPIIPCNLCGSQEGLKRQEMKKLIDDLEQKNPAIRAVMLHALKNIRPTHLLDPRIHTSENENTNIASEAQSPEHKTSLPILASTPASVLQ